MKSRNENIDNVLAVIDQISYNFDYKLVDIYLIM